MSDLPEWAQSMWESLGSPKIEEMESVHTGDLMDRRHGLRKDDLVEIQMDARALREDEDTWVRGRLLSSGKSSIELLTVEGEHKPMGLEMIHRGISTKKFKRQFRLSEHTEVHGATFEDGLLVIDLRVVVPDNKRPQKITIK